MKTRKVSAAGWLASGDSMGTLVDEGIMIKEYKLNTFTKTMDICWTLDKDADIIIDNGVDKPIHPGQTTIWEK